MYSIFPHFPLRKRRAKFGGLNIFRNFVTANIIKAMPSITRKIELWLCTEGLSDEQVKAQRQLLYHINDNLYRSANNISSKLYLDEHVSSMVRLKHAEYQSTAAELLKAKKNNADEVIISTLEDKIEILKTEMSEQGIAICNYATEMATRTLAGKFASELELNIYGQILAEVKNVVHTNFANDAREVREGKRSIRTYKKGMPMPFPWNKSIKIEPVKADSPDEGQDEYEFYLKWYNGLKFLLHFGKDRSNNYQIVKRCLNLDESCIGNYQLRTSSIKMVTGKKKPELYLLLVVDIPQEKHSLNKKIVVGVDLGINVPAYVATNITEDRKAIGNREHFLNMRMAIKRRFRKLQRLEGTASGKGRKKKLEPLDRYRKKERNWVHTQNHLFSRDVVNFAIQTRAATIQMEDLSGYGKDDNGNVEEKKKFLLGNWSYYELQTLIKNKALKAGITVNMIKPAYTSQTCSWCGERGIRDGTVFYCQNPQCKQHGKEDINADYNAARNIAKSKEIVK